jgi:hypothetical protein
MAWAATSFPDPDRTVLLRLRASAQEGEGGAPRHPHRLPARPAHLISGAEASGGRVDAERFASEGRDGLLVNAAAFHRGDEGAALPPSLHGRIRPRRSFARHFATLPQPPHLRHSPEFRSSTVLGVQTTASMLRWAIATLSLESRIAPSPPDTRRPKGDRLEKRWRSHTREGLWLESSLVLRGELNLGVTGDDRA